MTDTHELIGLPATVRDLNLDLTGMAQSVCLAASLPEETLRKMPECRALLNAWENLTGLSGDAALDAAQAITRHPLPVTAAVVPF